MAVRANDIALCDLSQDRRISPSSDPTNHVLLRSRIAVIELHHAWRESPAAIRTRNILELIQGGSGRAPVGALAFDVRRLAGSPLFRQHAPSPVHQTCVSSERVTVSADHVALLDLGDKLRARHQQCVCAREGEQFLARIAMIKVHHVRRKAAAAVVAWSTPQIPEPRTCRGLSSFDSIQFGLAMRRVIPDVVVALVLLSRHHLPV